MVTALYSGCPVRHVDPRIDDWRRAVVISTAYSADDPRVLVGVHYKIGHGTMLVPAAELVAVAESPLDAMIRAAGREQEHATAMSAMCEKRGDAVDPVLAALMNAAGSKA